MTIPFEDTITIRGLGQTLLEDDSQRFLRLEVAAAGRTYQVGIVEVTRTMDRQEWLAEVCDERGRAVLGVGGLVYSSKIQAIVSGLEYVIEAGHDVPPTPECLARPGQEKSLAGAAP